MRHASPFCSLMWPGSLSCARVVRHAMMPIGLILALSADPNFERVICLPPLPAMRGRHGIARSNVTLPVLLELHDAGHPNDVPLCTMSPITPLHEQMHACIFGAAVKHNSA